MNVLNVCSNFDPVTGGGEAERTFQMTRFLTLAGINSRVLTIDSQLSESRKQALGLNSIVALRCLFRRFYVPMASPRYIRRLVGESSVVHLIGHWTVLNAMVYLACRRLGKPYVVCPAGALSIFGRSKTLKKIYNYAIGQRIVRDASVCIAVTQSERDYFVSQGVAPDKVMVIPNGIAEADFISNNETRFRSKYSLGDKPFVLFVGRLNPIKGPDLLLEAFGTVQADLPDVTLVFAGPDGGMEEQLRAIVADKGLQDRVHFLGYLGGDDKSDAYHSAQLLVVPSRHEAMSIVAIEAGMCGTPVLLTDQCGFPELQDEGGGWIVPATVEGLAHGLLRVFFSGDVHSASLNIKTFVSRYFPWSAIVRSYIDLYTRLTLAEQKN